MKAWDDLTERGQFRRLRQVAEAALADWPLDVRRISLIGGFTNALFRIDTADGSRALRVDLFEDHTDAHADIELSWLEALANDTEVPVARPIRTRDGRLYTSAGAEGVPNARRCTLFEWVPGSPLSGRAGAGDMVRLGRYSAMLHEHAATWTPPSQPMAWDRIFYWPESVDPYVLDDERHAHHFGEGRREVLDRAIAAVEPAFAAVAAQPDQARLVHGDLHLENVHVRRGNLHIFDFEDAMWAHPVQDVAISLYYVRDEDQPEALREAFAEGYSSVRPWPEIQLGQIDAFIAARQLMFVNFVLNVLDDPTDFYDNVFPRLKRFLDLWE